MKMIRYPDIHATSSTMELPVVALVSGVLTAILVPVSVKFGASPILKIFAMVVAVPALLIFAYCILVEGRNILVRGIWAYSFSQRIRVGRVSELAGIKPDRFVLHMKYYGGFDHTRPNPAAVLEDKDKSQLIAIYPSSVRIPEVCKNLGVPVLEDRGKATLVGLPGFLRFMMSGSLILMLAGIVSYYGYPAVTEWFTAIEGSAVTKWLINIAVLICGSIFLSVLGEGVAGNESFSLPLMNIFLVIVISGTLFFWYEWVSTGIILAVHGAFCVLAGLSERSS